MAVSCLTRAFALAGMVSMMMITNSTTSAFCLKPPTTLFPCNSDKRTSITRRKAVAVEAIVDPSELAVWVVSFASSHIGMSAIRNTLIAKAGNVCNTLGLVGNDDWTLPSFWPGDMVGGRQLWPTSDIAGRQLYRFGYTLVSFVTLGSATALYLQSIDPSLLESSLSSSSAWIMVGAASSAAALTSLANASPLGLMPSFEAGEQGDNAGLMIQRKDELKFQVKGLTRITRHPLILPVVPWGIANAMLCGGRPWDWIFFGGLSLYAMAGCAAQDLRVSRQEGSVGTVFAFDDDDQLQTFFKETSFVPFGAILDGRQSLGLALQEIPWLAALPACLAGYYLEVKLLDFLSSFS